ncbi:MAG TPA: serine/threonine-protein kinase, partial [Isosphaeraceae bacterium]|nr:serine/threonine-protein kinase [Isosphaeraceae bacterium]
AATAFPKVGTEFVGFRLVGELGRGTFGRVYLGRQGELAGRLVALKVSTEIVAESQKLAQLQHTHIVPIHSLHRDGPLQAVCMPYFGSTTLADVLRDLGQLGGLPASGKGIISTVEMRRSRTRATLDPSDSSGGSHRAAAGPADATPLPGDLRRESFAPEQNGLRHLEELSYVEAVLWMGACLADGLHHAHERGIIHRDLKPANVLLADDGRPMLLDFNLAEDLHDRGDDAERPVGGTLPYMSPEHLAAFIGLPAPVPGSAGPRGKPRVDARSDVYSLGVILTELLIGKTPFARLPGSAEAVVPLMIADRLENVPPIRAYNPRVTPAVESILRKCLEADPARRYQSAEAFIEDVERHRADLPLRHAPNTSPAERMRKWVRRHPRLASPQTALAAAAVAALVVAGLCVQGVVSARHQEAQRLTLIGKQKLRDLEEDTTLAEHFLASTAEDSPRLADGVAKGVAALEPLGVLDDADWLDRPEFAGLLPEEKGRLKSHVGYLAYLLTRAERTAKSAPRPA